jgi:hypothetical protein
VVSRALLVEAHNGICSTIVRSVMILAPDNGCRQCDKRTEHAESWNGTHMNLLCVP